MIAFDLDDVICNLSELVIKEVYVETGYKVPSDRTDYHINIPGWEPYKTDSIIEDIIIKKSINCLPVVNSIETISHIYDCIGTPIIIITARKQRWKEITSQWLKKYVGDKFEYRVFFSSGINKSEFITPNIRYFVDDRLKYALDVANKVKTVFLVNKSWNQIETLPDNIKRINDISDILKTPEFNLCETANWFFGNFLNSFKEEGHI